MVIEISDLEKYSVELPDFLDGIIAGIRKDDEKVPLETVINNLKRDGKLK